MCEKTLFKAAKRAMKKNETFTVMNVLLQSDDPVRLSMAVQKSLNPLMCDLRASAKSKFGFIRAGLNAGQFTPMV